MTNDELIYWARDKAIDAMGIDSINLADKLTQLCTALESCMKENAEAGEQTQELCTYALEHHGTHDHPYWICLWCDTRFESWNRMQLNPDEHASDCLYAARLKRNEGNDGGGK